MGPGNGPHPIKLLDITEFYSPSGGGVRTYLQSKARWLSGQEGWEHTIVLPSHRNATEQWYSSRVHFVEGPQAPASPGYHLLTAAGSVRAILERERPDVVEIGSPFLAQWVTRRAARLADPVLVGYYHCDVPSVYVKFGLRTFPVGLQRLADATLRQYLTTIYRKMHHMVAATPSAAAALQSLGIEDVTTIPLGVDTELFHPSRRDLDWRADVGAEPTDTVALYVGRFAAEKGLDVLLAASPGLARSHGLKVVLIGEGHLRDRLLSIARESGGKLTVKPYETDRQELARAYASADVYIAPFPYETFGLSAAEAMACGTPVVGADSGGLKDLLGSSRCGRLFSPGDPESLTLQVLSMLEDGTNELSKRARKLVEERYSWDRTFGMMMALYEQLARRKRSHG